MKIYQLHEYSGQWEDYRNYIIGSYLRKERAEEEKIKAELKEKKLRECGQKCACCPFSYGYFADLNKLLNKHPKYCDKSNELEDDGDEGIYCRHYYVHVDDATFKIKEVEVEE